MKVRFCRTGLRRYAVIVEPAGAALQALDPAPGYDDHIPHDLVHYLVEAELELTAGVFGRAARGGGSFITRALDGSPRERARQRRKQRKRELSLDLSDESEREMVTSERLAAVCDLLWRKRHAQTPDLLRPQPPQALSRREEERVSRVLAHLDRLAPEWRKLPVGASLVFSWPGTSYTVEQRH